MTKHKQTIGQHVATNILMAIDSADSYDSLTDAGLSYMENTRNSVLEDGYSAEEAFDAGNWFITEFTRRTGVEV